MSKQEQVNPATMLLCNFLIANTGGSATAWAKEFPNALVMVTDESGINHQIGSNPDDPVLVGVVDDEGEPIQHQETTVANLPVALLKAIGIAERHPA
mgnify:CR=1 FL=1|tara:strand:- start:2876 stop:3166 length:291 start_codon:yes stop_codon:yes gene_type:complete